MSAPAILEKLARLQSGAPPRVLDLFSGCGGISLGFQRAGFDILGAIDNDPEAAATHARAFHGGADADSRHAHARDITQTEPVSFLRELGIEGDPRHAVDVLV